MKAFCHPLHGGGDYRLSKCAGWYFGGVQRSLRVWEQIVYGPCPKALGGGGALSMRRTHFLLFFYFGGGGFLDFLENKSPKKVTKIKKNYKNSTKNVCDHFPKCQRPLVQLCDWLFDPPALPSPSMRGLWGWGSSAHADVISWGLGARDTGQCCGSCVPRVEQSNGAE